MLKGPAVVTAADIAIDSDIEVVNTDQHIATVSEGGQFEMIIYVGKGRGFVPADGNKNVTYQSELFQSIQFIHQ